MKVKAKLAKVPHIPFEDFEYVEGKGGYKHKPQAHAKTKTLRKTVYTNFHKLKDRRRLLNENLKKGKRTTFSDFMWAKMWRKIELLKRITPDLVDEPNLQGYDSTNKVRAAQVLDSVKQTEEHYRNFANLFQDVPENFGYGYDLFTDFIKTIKKRDEKPPMKLPKRYMSHFQ